jgi:hypothetical protein
MRLPATLAVVLCLSATAASASLDDTGPQPLAWAPPVLSNPVSVEVSNANHRLYLDNSRDYRLTVVETLTRDLWIDGGRNVVVIGGRVSITTLGSGNSYWDNTAVKLRGGDPAGTIHVEGLFVDGPYVNDGIAIATGRNVQIQNVRVERARDEIKGGHADCLQVQQGVGHLRMDGFTCTTGRQGIFLGDDTWPPTTSADLRRVNIDAAGGKHLLFQIRPAHPVALRDVWLGVAPGFTPWAPFGYWVFPQKDGRTLAGTYDRRRRSVVSRDGKRLWFVGSNIEGVVRKGGPPLGDFVPSGLAGMSYASPGYAAAAGGAR